MGTTFDLIVTAGAIIVGILLLTGHGDILFKGGNDIKRKSVYDEAKMQKACGIAFVIVGVLTGIDTYIGTIVGNGRMRMIQETIYLVVIVVVFVGLFVYLRKKCMK